MIYNQLVTGNHLQSRAGGAAQWRTMQASSLIESGPAADRSRHLSAFDPETRAEMGAAEKELQAGRDRNRGLRRPAPSSRWSARRLPRPVRWVYYIGSRWAFADLIVESAVLLSFPGRLSAHYPARSGSKSEASPSSISGWMYLRHASSRRDMVCLFATRSPSSDDYNCSPMP
jgi:hypothetical protein